MDTLEVIAQSPDISSVEEYFWQKMFDEYEQQSCDELYEQQLPIIQINPQCMGLYPKPIKIMKNTQIKKQEVFLFAIEADKLPNFEQPLEASCTIEGFHSILIGKTGNYIRFISNLPLFKFFWSDLKDERRLIILHDFYQHPVNLAEFVGNIQISTIVPYVPDLINCLSSSTSAEPMYFYIKILQQLLMALKFQNAAIVGHGSGCALAVKLAQQSHPPRLYLLSPFQKLRSKTKKKRTESQNIVQPINEQQFEASVQSTGEEVLQVTNLQDKQINETSEITEVHGSTQFEVVVRESPKRIDKAPPVVAVKQVNNVTKPITVDPNNTELFLLATEPLTVPSLNDLSVSNIILQQFYNKNLIKINYFKMLQLRPRKPLRILSSVQDFAAIFKTLRSHQNNIDEFIRKSYILYFCAPFSHIKTVVQNQKAFDKQFFSAINDVIDTVLDQSIILAENTALQIYYGSHDVLITTSTLCDFQVIQTPLIRVSCLQLQGHDLFSYSHNAALFE